MPTRCLSIHAGWRCQQAGACCRAGWAIPVEGPAFDVLRTRFGPSRARELFVTGGPLPDEAAAILAADDRGTCRLYDGRLCTIQRELGPGAMPVACRQFPRRALADGRGTSITLSHFCPTAAALLLREGPLSIVEAPSSLSHLSLGGAVEGLDASAVLPPLLRPGLLTDLDGYDRWERSSIEVLASDQWPAETSIERIAGATSRLLSWTPARGPMAEAVADAFGHAAPDARPASAAACRHGYELARRAVPAGLRAPGLPDDSDEAIDAAGTTWGDFDRGTRAFLAAHLFGNWIAYRGTGLATIVEFLRVCLSVLRIELARSCGEASDPPRERRFLEAVRRADLLLIHLVDDRVLAQSLDHDQHVSARAFSQIRHDRHPLG